MNIEFNTLWETVLQIDSEANLIGPLKEKYKIASIFYPVVNGFFFLVNSSCNPNSLNIIDGLFIIHDSNTNALRNLGKSNAAIVTKKDPQLLYYYVLNIMFTRESTGKISLNSEIESDVDIGENVEIGPFCHIKSGVSIGKDVIISSHCILESGTKIRTGTIIDSGCHIGAQGVSWVWDEESSERITAPQLGGVEVGEKVFIGSNNIIVRGSFNENTKIGSKTMIAPGCKIGHGSVIGRYVHMANGVIVAGNTKIRDFCFIGSGSIFRPRVEIHRGTVVAAGAVVINDTNEESLTLMGVPAKEKKSKEVMAGVPQSNSKLNEGDKND